MDCQTFNEIVKERLEKCTALLVPKGEEYARNGDRLHNFKVTARIDGETPEKALWGMWKKHITSVKDMIDDVENGKIPTDKMLDEKICDMINYSLLLEGLFKERMINEKRDIETEKWAERITNEVKK